MVPLGIQFKEPMFLRFLSWMRLDTSTHSKLSTKLTELEADATNPDALHAVQGLLKTLDTTFKTHQLAIIDLTNDDDGLSAEQQELDDHNDRRLSSEAYQAGRAKL